MRYLVLSDIHANLEALEAVLDAARALPHDRVLVLGDLVGYGADPNAVVDRVRGLSPHAVIRGNHDKVGAGLESPEAFNTVARAAIRWTYEALSDDNRDWLAELPAGPVAIDELVEICHGTPFDEDVYVFDDTDVLRSMEASSRRVCLFGHTHVHQVKFNRAWYGTWMPKLVQGFEDGMIDIAADPNIAQDLRAIEEVDGIPMVAKVRRKDIKDPDLFRHGDSASMLALGWFATLNLSAAIDFTPLPALPRGFDNLGTADNSDEAEDYLRLVEPRATW